MRRTGLNKRQVLSVSPSDMPKPVLDPAARSKVQVDPEHGLWGFFNPERTMFATPEWNHQHGRSWQVSELRKKHWNDLWCLWWVCVRERNRLSTEEHARHATDKNTFGQSEAEERDKEVRLFGSQFAAQSDMEQVQRTMTAIKRVLTERWYAWEDARVLAEKDPKINLNPGPGQRGHSPRDKRPQQLQTSAVSEPLLLSCTDD